MYKNLTWFTASDSPVAHRSLAHGIIITEVNSYSTIRQSKQLIFFRLWQYGLWSFQTGGTKLERFLPKNQHTQRKLLNFENWVNGEVSKIGHHFSK